MTVCPLPQLINVGNCCSLQIFDNLAANHGFSLLQFLFTGYRGNGPAFQDLFKWGNCCMVCLSCFDWKCQLYQIIYLFWCWFLIILISIALHFILISDRTGPFPIILFFAIFFLPFMHLPLAICPISLGWFSMRQGCKYLLNWGRARRLLTSFFHFAQARQALIIYQDCENCIKYDMYIHLIYIRSLQPTSWFTYYMFS